jgi:hypothetical protein
MKNIPIAATLVLILLPFLAVGAGESGEETIAGLRLGMTEQEVNGQYPDGKITFNEAEMTVEGRYGNFRRGDLEFQNGLTMFKLRPSGLDSRAGCLSFFDEIKPALTERYGEPGSSSASDEPSVGTWQAAWQAPGLYVSIESVWYEEQKTCAAEIFVRPTDIEPL